MKLRKTLVAASIAGAAVPLALYANNMERPGVTFSNAVSEAYAEPSVYYPHDRVALESSSEFSAIDSGSTRFESPESAPDSVTWFYPDGRVFHQYGMAFVEEAPQSASLGSSSESIDSGFDQTSSLWDASFDDTWIVAEIVEPIQPDYLVILQ